MDRTEHGDEQVKLSISEAARRAGVERPTLYRKMKGGELSKEIDQDGKPVIDLAELARLYPHAVTMSGIITASSAVDTDNAVLKNTSPNSLLQAELEMVRERLLELEADKSDLRSERDKLLALLQEQSASMRILTDQRPQQKSWLAQLFGR